MTHSLLQIFRLQPLYSTACAATLALAVGAGVASFTVVKQALLDPLPYPESERLITIMTANNSRFGGMSVFVFQDLKQASQHAIAALTAYRFTNPTLEAGDVAEALQAREVTPDYFDTLRVYPRLGGVFAADDRNVAIVSHRFWERWLSSDPSAIGRRITLDGVPHTVVGVMPADFLPPFDPQNDVWQPLDMRPLLQDTARARRTITVLARLAPGVSREEADAFMATFTAGQQTQYPTIHGRESFVIRPLHEEIVGPSRPALLGTAAAALLLMLIACANIAGLSAVNAASQGHRYAIRAALGATASRLFRERLKESFAVAAVGTTAGIWIGYLLIEIARDYQQQFLAAMPPLTFAPSTATIGIAFGAITGVVAASVPHAVMRRLLTGDPMRAARTVTGDRRLATVRGGLVFVQVAIAVVLIVCAGLLVRTVNHLATTSLGFDSEQLTYFQATLPQPKYRGTPQHLQFERELLDRIRAIPGVTGVSASVGLPPIGVMSARLTILDRPDQNAPPEIGYYSVTPDFFSFIDVPIIEGRDIASTDVFEAPRVVVINETMARMFWPDGNAIGSRVKIGAGAASDREITVVGISADVRQNGPTQAVRPIAYGSTLQYSWPRRHIAVKTDRMYTSLPAQLRAAVHEIDPSVATTMPRPIDDAVAQQMARHRLVMLTLSIFGAVATVLCALGLYAAVALNSQFRRREYAIRVALGSTRARVCWLVVRQALGIAAAGALTGLVAATTATEAIGSLLHGVAPVDAITFAATFLIMVALAALSASWPAAKAGRVNPVDTLRSE